MIYPGKVSRADCFRIGTIGRIFEHDIRAAPRRHPHSPRRNGHPRWLLTRRRPRYTGPLKAVILDWAGTVVDFGSCAPAGVFVEVFARHGVPITMAAGPRAHGLRKARPHRRHRRHARSRRSLATRPQPPVHRSRHRCHVRRIRPPPDREPPPLRRPHPRHARSRRRPSANEASRSAPPPATTPK